MYSIILKSKQQQSIKDRHLSGRPNITIAQTDADLVGNCRANLFKTARSAVAVVETGLKRYNSATIILQLV